MAQLIFNTTGQEEMDDFGTVDPGKYVVQITKSELKPTSKKDGERLNFTFKILEGKFKGRFIFSGLNVKNPNKQAEEISMKELTSICKACGVVDLKDTNQLHAIPIVVDVVIKPAEGEYQAQNRIKSYKPYSVGADHLQADSGSQVSESTETETTTKKKPWEE